MIVTEVGEDGRPILSVPFRRRVDRVWLGLLVLFLGGCLMMSNPDVEWPRSDDPISDTFRLPLLGFSAFMVAAIVLVLLIRWLTWLPALRVADGRVFVYAVYRWHRFAVEDIRTLTPVHTAEKGSSTRHLMGGRWFAFDYGGVTLAALGSRNIRADIDEVHQQVVAILGIEPTPLSGPPPWDAYDHVSPWRHALRLPDRQTGPPCVCDDAGTDGCASPGCSHAARQDTSSPPLDGAHDR